MMDRSDRHFRFFLRQITRRCLLYTEMVTTGAVIHGDRERLLGFDPREKPVALQLGGDDPEALAECARIGEGFGYDEINLNVGCPSDRVQKGRIGACLMAEPERVADGVAAMRAAVSVPVTVKHRIGIDHLDRYEDMERFVTTVAAAGSDRFTVHARIAWLQGLSPKENRDIPPLRYEDVHRLKREHPGLSIEINGGVRSLDAVEEHLREVDGVMIGRAACDDPYLFAAADQRFFDPETVPPSRREILEAMVEYSAHWNERGLPVARIFRHLMNLCAGLPGARLFRRHLSEQGHGPAAGPEILQQAIDHIPTPILEQRPAVGEGVTA